MKTVIVTGGAQGIGRAVAQRFAAEGYRVVVADINVDVALDTAAELRELTGNPDVLGSRLNVTDAEQVASLYGGLVGEYGGVDVLVNCAGITRDGRLVKMEEADWDAVLGVNLKGPFLMGREFARRVNGNGGVIVNISSIVGEDGNFGQSNYGAAKAGLINLTKTWARELARAKVRVNAVLPGFTETPMTAAVPEKALEAVKGKTPMGRMARPEEIANAVYFLASDEASFITGETLRVDGGLSL